jgi:hypothetical protein
MMQSHQRIFDRDPSIFAELPEGTGDGLARGAGHGSHFLVGEQQREAELAGVEVLANLIGQFEKQPSQAGGHCFREGDAAGVLEGEPVFLADALDRAHLRFLVAAQEVKEPFPLDGTQLSIGQGLGRDLIKPMGENGVEAEHGAGAGDAHDHLLFFQAASGELEIAAADEIEAAGVFSLSEKGSLSGQRDGAGGQFEIGENGAAQGAEPTRTAIGTSRATCWNLPGHVPVPGVFLP